MASPEAVTVTAADVVVAPRASGGSGVNGAASQPAAGATYDVDLWLVRSLPGKPNEVTSLTYCASTTWRFVHVCADHRANQQRQRRRARRRTD